MSVENSAFDEKAYIRQRFMEQTKDLPPVAKLKARLGFAFNRVGQNETVKKWLDKFSKPQEVSSRTQIDPLSPDAPNSRPGTNMGTRTGGR